MERLGCTGMARLGGFGIGVANFGSARDGCSAVLGKLVF